MRVVIQRTGHASVTINGTCKSAIRKGFMILVGIEETDGKEDIDWSVSYTHLTLPTKLEV